MPPRHPFASRTLLATGLLAAALGCGSGDGSTSSSPPEPVDPTTLDALTEITTPAVPLGEAGPAWLAADETVRAAFEQDFVNDDDENAVLARHVGALGGAALLDFLEYQDRFCHAAAATVGAALYESTHDLAGSLETCGTRCADGCMHGVVAAAFGGESYDALVGKLGSACSTPGLDAYRPGSCAHGLGQALMTATGDDVKKSLDGCASFETPGLDYGCALGVFMAYRGTLVAKRARGESSSRPTPHFPCDSIERFRAACYRHMMTEIRYRSSGRADHLLEECQRLTGAERRGCFHGLGATFSRAIARRPETLTEICGAGEGDERTLCVEGAVEPLSESDVESATALCANFEGDLAESCRAAVGGTYRLDKPTMALYRE